jgi:UrcA family protein
MSNRLKSAGLAALSFSLSAGLLAAVLSPALASASPLDTQTGNERMTVQVKVDDLDLTSATDQRKLDRRIRNAARDVCDTGESDRIRHYERLCLRNAVGSAAPEVAGLIGRAERVAEGGRTDRAGRALAMTGVEVR